MKHVTVLKFRVENPSERLVEIGEMCRRGWNAGIEDWLLRQRGMPESAKQVKPTSESGKIYHAIRVAEPRLNTTVASMLASNAARHLTAKVDWRRRDEKTAKRSDAILAHEDRPPFRTSLQIPIRSARSKAVFTDSLSLSFQAVETEFDCVDLSLKKVTAGQKNLLRSAIDGELRMPDSMLVQHDGKWYWHVPIIIEVVEAKDPAVEAHLWPVSAQDERTDRPFRLMLPKRGPWYVGDGRYYAAQASRLLTLIKQIGWRYRQRNGSGHGRKKIDSAVRKRRHQLANIRSEVRRRAIVDVVRQCERAGCGTLVYHEPTGPAKTLCWFDKNGLDWDWTAFLSGLKNSLAKKKIAVKVKKLKIKDIKCKESSVATAAESTS